MNTQQIIDQYRRSEESDDEQDHKHKSGWCDECDVPLIDCEHFMCCPKCGACSEKEFVHYATGTTSSRTRTIYKELNHFKSILAMIQDKEKRVIPKDVIQDVKHVMIGDVTPEEVRKALKLTGHVKYYKNTVQIVNQLRGTSLCNPLTPDEESRVCETFTDILCRFRQSGIESKRKNFLNYNFLAAEILTMEGRSDLAACCKPLKPGAHKAHTKLLKQVMSKCT